MTRRMFPKDAPRITFTKDFRQIRHGDLLPGRTVTLTYDAERLPNERSEEQGQKAWTIKAFYKFVEAGEVHATDLWSESGKILHKVGDEPGEGTMMTGRIALPEDADHLTVWFQNSGKSGAQFWDSNFGRNYTFRFVVEDLDVRSAEVVRDPKGPLCWFRVTVAAVPEVSDLTVMYRIMNDPAAPREDQRLPLTLAAAPGKSGQPTWSGATSVPEGAVVRLTFSYSAYGNPHADTNSGKGYVTWLGAKQNHEAGIL